MAEITSKNIFKFTFVKIEFLRFLSKFFNGENYSHPKKVHLCTISFYWKKLSVFFLYFLVQNFFDVHIYRYSSIPVYITQSSLLTTIYVQNLSFFVSQILTSHNFFSIWPIYIVFMGDTEQVWNFLTPSKKG